MEINKCSSWEIILYRLPPGKSGSVKHIYGPFWIDSSFQYVSNKSFQWFVFQWVPEITHHCQKTPFLLVGTQIDLRDDAATAEKLQKNRQKPISYEQGEKLAKDLRAVKYVECSALTQVQRVGICSVVLFT